MHTIDRMSAVSIGGKVLAVGEAGGTLHAAGADANGNVALPAAIAKACRAAGLRPKPGGITVAEVDTALAGKPLAERIAIKQVLNDAGQIRRT